MKTIANAKIEIVEVYVNCPHCGVEIENPETGALVFYVPDWRGRPIRCEACNKESVIMIAR